jgi:hypothetical protein
VRKLDRPTTDPIVAYETCVAAVSNAALRATYETSRPHIVQAKADFDNVTATASWANLPRVPWGNSGTIVAGDLTKKHLTDLYSSYMVGAKGPSRKIYDDLLVSAGGMCPFCGGLGHVHTLDHYLPKSSFPLYSTHPSNLVPCCRDCHTGKNSAFGAGVHDQTLHPYLDDERFFQERWISAEVVRTNPIVLKFRCSPPPAWSDCDKLRVQQHFGSYQIADRFSVQSGAELARVVDLRCYSLRCLPAKDYLLDNANSADFDLNGWSRTMFAALAETDWFLETDFTNPDWHLP